MHVDPSSASKSSNARGIIQIHQRRHGTWDCMKFKQQTYKTITALHSCIVGTLLFLLFQFTLIFFLSLSACLSLIHLEIE